MTRDQFHAVLTRTKLTYQPVEDPARPTADDLVTVTRETEREFAVWRLDGETWLRCGTITIEDDARAWNACQMERFWRGRTGPSLQLGGLPCEPQPLAGATTTSATPLGPVASILRVVHLVWAELQGGPLGYQPLWCDEVDLGLPLSEARRGQAKRRTCTVVDVRGSGRALRWA